ncbi:MAG: hypothetical protein KA731_00400 [Candidatus Moranbacteria bacterium]|nr:hypothetical protein [Candidatus Moranbacteria bacterium]MBP6033879.1 hypothetical protein [Candidatus Moranbacteria bacterium]MBP7695663.1 hypothetical protein [Candidatus Moranbacteria bacterium]
MFVRHHLVRYFTHNIAVVVGVVFVWRGIWHLLDIVDIKLFDGNLAYTAVGGIVLGLLILYLPDKDLKELGNL